MGIGIKLALPGYDAFTDKDPNHFSLYVDRNESIEHILIKEKMKNQVSVTTSLPITHGLNYVPHCLVFFEYSPGVWRKVFSRAIDGTGSYYTVDSTNLTLYGTGNFIYHIFFDNIT